MDATYQAAHAFSANDLSQKLLVSKIITSCKSTLNPLFFPVSPSNANLCDAVQTRHGEGLMGLVLSGVGGIASNLLQCGGNDEVGVVHGQQVGSELAAEVVLGVEFLPVLTSMREGR